jgi:phosphoesterase RecJ-like protein
LEKKDIEQNYWNLYLYRILTDSGSFRFQNNRTTHRIIAELIDLGVENTEIPTLLFDNSSTVDTIIGWALQNMKVLAHHTAYTTLTQEELNSFDYVKGDTEE